MHISRIPAHLQLVVLIDDNEIDGFILNSYLREANFTGVLKEFTHPLAALNFFKENNLSEQSETEGLLIFLDLHMPELSGTDFLRELQKINPRAIERVCMLSSDYQEVQQRVVGDYPVAGYMSKPFSLQKLYNLLSGTATPY